MTPAEILSQARSQFDDPSSAFITDTEGYAYIWQGLYELCDKSDVRQISDTSITTVNGTSEYTMPSDFIKVQNMTWNGDLILRKNIEDFQATTGSNPSSGNPQWYQWWGKVLTLTPTPTSAQTVKIYGFGRPTKITAGNATTDIFTNDGIEEAYQQDVIDYVLYRMYYKDDDRKATEHLNLWELSLKRIELAQKQRDNMDAHNTVTTTDDDNAPWSFL